jgi:Predicted ring-cleavage extradiol dioxygenase
MRLDGFGLLVENMGEMIRFYRDVLGFEIKEEEDQAVAQQFSSLPG